MEQATHFLKRFQQAATLAEKQAITNEYKAFYETLSPAQQRQADEVMQELKVGIRQKLDDLEPLMAKATALLNRSVTPV